MDVAIIDYGMGNLLSVQRAFEKCGSRAVIVNDPVQLREADHIVLPGVGSFPDAMKNLRDGSWIQEIDLAVMEDKIPLLGICLGMQLLAGKGYEMTECQGLGYIPGNVRRLEQAEPDERIPHVGWNDIEIQSDTEIFDDIVDGTNYYFVHSYHFVPENTQDIAATTPYCGGFVSAVARDNIIGTQFHPEKSQKAGFQLIKNFIKM